MPLRSGINGRAATADTSGKMMASRAFEKDDLSSAQPSDRVQENPVVLAPGYAVDYEAALQEAKLEDATQLAGCLRKLLLARWRDAYIAAVERQTNLVRFRSRSFEYVLDLYSELEAMGEIPYDQTVEDRVVAVVGNSAVPDAPRAGTRIHGWLGETGEIVGSTRDKGHFIARCIGGGLDVNVFSQERKLNRGWSAQGKIYRQMERYCQERPGTLCFSRPVYSENSSVPHWLEFGLLKEDETLWVETFDNVLA